MVNIFILYLLNHQQKWNEAKEKEIQEKITQEQKNWEQSIELQTQERIEAEVEERIQQGRAQWKAAADRKLSEEIQSAVEKARREWADCHEENVQKIREDMEESIQERIATEVCVCVKEVCSCDKGKNSMYFCIYKNF